MKKLLTLALAFVTLVLIGTGVVTAQTQTIILNTGYDQSSNTKINVSQQDNEWRVMQSTPNNPPSAPPSTGRPADVVSDTVWNNKNSALPANFPNSGWISFAPNAGSGSSTIASYIYAFYFTLPDGIAPPQLTMRLSGDDNITSVRLNNCPAPLFTGPGGRFDNPVPLTISSTLTCFNSGPKVNVLNVTVRNTFFWSITGLIVDGTVTYQDCARPQIRDIPGLASITFWESTGAAPTPHTVGDSQLATRLNALNPSSRDFEGVSGAELYDVFYSNWDGTPSLTGQFVTIEAVWNARAPSGGGLNIARVDFNGTSQSADSVASFAALGDNAMPNDVVFAVDGNLQTDTTMGNTIGTPQRLRITVGFPCPQCVPPAPGMVAWWPLDEQAGATMVEDIAGSFDGGTPKPGGRVGYTNNWHGPEPYPGVVDGALYFFNGIHVEAATPSTDLDFGTGDFSIDAWIEVITHQSNFAIVEKFDPSSGTGFVFGLTNMGLYLDINGTKFYSAPSSGFVPGRWTHVAVTVKRNNPAGGIFYIDGVQSAAAFAPPAGSVNNTLSLLIARSRRYPTMGDFVIDELEIFKRALDPSEIQSIFNAGLAGKCKCIILATCRTAICVTKFDDLNGNGVRDSGEPLLPGWTFQVKSPSGSSAGTITTGGSTPACVAAPASGTYTISEVLQPGWTPTTPNPQTAAVAAGRSVNLSFGSKKNVKGKCDLEITKTISPKTLASGQPATVTITVKNKGKEPCAPGAFPGSAMRDPKPAGLTFTAPPVANQPGWSCSLGIPTGDASCANQSLLPPGYSVTFTIKARVTALPGSSITNCATVSNGNDAKPANNKSCVTVKVKK
jgi:hypothetical protein